MNTTGDPTGPVWETAIGASLIGGPDLATLTYYAGASYYSNDKNATGDPEPPATAHGSPDLLALASSIAGLILSAAGIAVSGPYSTAIAVASTATGLASLVFGANQNQAPPTLPGDEYDYYITRVYEGAGGVSNATLAAAFTLGMLPDVEAGVSLVFMLPPGPAFYPHAGAYTVGPRYVSITLIVHS